MKGYYFITDRIKRRRIDERCQKAVAAGVRIIQYRNKQRPRERSMTRPFASSLSAPGTSTRLIINDRVDIALAVDADGVHIGQEDMPYHEARRLLGKDKIIGVTVHTLEEAITPRRRAQTTWA